MASVTKRSFSDLEKLARRLVEIYMQNNEDYILAMMLVGFDSLTYGEIDLVTGMVWVICPSLLVKAGHPRTL